MSDCKSDVSEFDFHSGECHILFPLSSLRPLVTGQSAVECHRLTRNVLKNRAASRVYEEIYYQNI